MFLVLCGGIIAWIVGVVEYFALSGDVLHALFLLVFGGQLVKLAYAFVASEDLDKKHDEIMKKLRDRF